MFCIFFCTKFCFFCFISIKSIISAKSLLIVRVVTPIFCDIFSDIFGDIFLDIQFHYVATTLMNGNPNY